MEKLNKKGFAIELIAIIIVGFIALIFFALWGYGIGLINNVLISVPSTTSAVNVSDAALNTFSFMNTGMNGLKIIGFMILFGFSIATLIIAYFSRENPIMAFVYFMVLILAIIFSVFVSNAYEGLLTNSAFGSTLSSFGIGTWVLLHLPYWIGTIGLFGIILMLARIYQGEAA